MSNGPKSLKTPNIPYMGIRILANRAEIFMVTPETIIHQLVINNSGFGLKMPFSIFWGLKRAWPYRYPYGSGTSEPNQRVDPLGGPFGSLVILELCFKLF